MLAAIGIALLSLILIYLEFFVPGAVLGVLGGVGFCLSILLFIWELATPWQIIIFVIAIIVLLVLTIKMALWKLKQKPAMFAKEKQSNYLASEFDKEMIGKPGEAITDLKPSGYVRVEGKRHQAVSESLYIKKGESVKIIAGEGARLIVRKQ
ncbi:MAG: NfeD family protein [Candidatus Neptunochlamydia sp.]|nr:NfeD family protein [Candidatus Neptunochlamydia sp.]